MDDPVQACNLAKQAFDDAMAEVAGNEKCTDVKVMTILQIMKERIETWIADLGMDPEFEI